MEARPEEVQASGPGRQETLTFKQTKQNFDPLHRRLKLRQIDPEMRAGLWMMVESMRDRNYLAAYDVYLRWVVLVAGGEAAAGAGGCLSALQAGWMAGRWLPGVELLAGVGRGGGWRGQQAQPPSSPPTPSRRPAAARRAGWPSATRPGPSV
jgi:hypothetical protein